MSLRQKHTKGLDVCLLQMDLTWENPQENYLRIEHLLEKQGLACDLVILPEMFTTGFSMKPQGLAEQVPGPTSEWMQAMASKYNTTLLGSIIVEQDGRHFNRLLAVNSEGVQLSYDKRHLFRMAGEDAHYAAGQARPVLELKGWKILPQVCYDLRFPVWTRNQWENGTADYDVLVYLANWPSRRAAHWRTLLAARAIENQCYVLGVNRVGEDGNGFNYRGDSMVIDPKGEQICSGSMQPQVLRASLDKASLEAYREKFPAWQDADKFSLG